MSCCTYQGRYDFPALYEGDTFISREIRISENTGTSLASARLVFSKDGAPTKTLTVGSGLTLTATVAGGWVITIDDWVVNIAIGIHIFDLETTDAEGIVRHYLGGSFKVIKAIA
jgi:hypothetical protein